MRIFKCLKCGNIDLSIKDGSCVPTCCGDSMKVLVANGIDASFEKHVPVVEIHDQVVEVTCGEVLHPMDENHYIEFMMIETSLGYQIHYLHPGEEPKCIFSLSSSEKLICAYAYCNLHGLWKNQ